MQLTVSVYVRFRCVMSMKRLAILSAASSGVNGNYNGTGNANSLTNPTPGYPNHVAVHGINVMLGGSVSQLHTISLHFLCVHGVKNTVNRFLMIYKKKIHKTLSLLLHIPSYFFRLYRWSFQTFYDFI